MKAELLLNTFQLFALAAHKQSSRPRRLVRLRAGRLSVPHRDRLGLAAVQSARAGEHPGPVEGGRGGWRGGAGPAPHL